MILCQCTCIYSPETGNHLNVLLRQCMTREGYTFANSLYPTTRFSRYSMGTGNGAIENSIYTKSRKSFERFIEALHDKRK